MGELSREIKELDVEKLEEAVLITGAAQRLGLYHARRLVQEGYNVIITYRTHRDTIGKLAEEGLAVLQADFSTIRGIHECIDAVKRRCSSLRAVIHNASLWTSDAEVLNNNTALEELMHIHMSAPFYLNHRLKELLLASKAPWRDIIHMTDYTVVNGSRFHAAYSASKAGMENMTRSFAALLAPEIKVNSIAPALVKFNAWDSKEYREKARDKSVMGFEPGEDVSYQAVSYLMKNSYVTGTTLHLDGGRHLV